MRTIDATLLGAQDSLGGRPAVQVVIGTAPSTVTVSSFVLAYDYQEEGRIAHGLTLVLDNKGGEFSSLAGDYANIALGAEVEVKRGLDIGGTEYVAELPTTWIEGWHYEYRGGQSLFVLDCIDFWGKLERIRVASDQEWSATSATTILEWILNEAGLTRESGSMTALSLDFAIRQRETLKAALIRLVRKMPEYLHPGLDGEVKWREIDAGDASQYTFGWNADHPVVDVEGGQEAWQYNSITVNGVGSATGTASDATQIAAVGTRKLTLYDVELDSNAECEARAQAELDLAQAEAAAIATIICRPCHGLELYDVVTMDSPPWGGSNVVGRVVAYREEWNMDGRWHQAIELGDVPSKDPGQDPRAKKRKKGRRRRKRRGKGRRRRRPGDGDGIEDRLDELLPIGIIVMWSGSAVPTNWALCNGSNGTPDLSGSFIVASGGVYSVGDSGGADEVDLSHVHGPGTLTTDSDAHTHGPGSLNTASDSHDHDVDSGETASGGAHTHGLTTNTATITGGATVYTATDETDSDGAHTHGPGTLNTASDSHDHDVDSGTTASDSHDHAVDSGETASGGSATHDNRPVYYCLAFIMRIS